jgi:hypothetical protein
MWDPQRPTTLDASKACCEDSFTFNLLFQIVLSFLIDIESTSRFLLRPPLWTNGQSSWLQIQMSRLDSLHYPGMGSTQTREYN